MVIEVLRPEVVNQIAAGEVIERPYSVVKELVENALDAGARRIEVEIEEGGARLVRVVDDGSGFAPEDLPLAFASHATSKLRALADLDHIASLGFRGEALASIGSVARARIRSRLRGAEAGYEIECQGGELSAVRPCGCPEGTQVEVRDLFFNTPARRRFLKTASAERARIQDLLAKMALVRLDVEFTLRSEGRVLLRLPPGDDLGGRLARVYGQELAAACRQVDLGGEGHRVHGLLAPPELARRDGSMELLYVNGRLARDRGTVAAIRTALRERLMHGRIPVYVLALDLPPAEVDVNVHPTKAEVRFANPRRVYGLLHTAVQRAFAAAAGAAAPGVVQGGSGLPRATPGFPDLPRDLFGRPTEALRQGVPTPSLPFPAPRADRVSEAEPALVPPPAPGDAARPGLPARGGVLQVLDLYLVFEGQDGLVVIDQHALHERVLYERLQRRSAAAPPAVQRLLVPEVMELSPLDKAWLLEAAPVLAEEGFLVEDFGGNAVAVHGLPAVLGRARARDLVTSFLQGDDGEARPRARDAILERFHSMACRGAVMSGDPLAPAEVEALLAEASRLRHPHHCPHGRPTTLTLSRAELERYFRRKL
ncbi:MAG: DNA mismatch repair endonuclease MutL [Planctomycetes bacterium]|nr:DNA mismatch repair endonuclease MutL [Planctomycetota bacterium]